MADHLEIEHKYDAGPDFTLPDLSDLPGCADVSEPETQRLVANYFDTDDLRLISHGITLRRRSGGDDPGWHLKVPVGVGTRRELHSPLKRGAQSVPSRLATLVAAYTHGRALRPVATLKTRRTVIRLLGDDGAVLAEVADDKVTGQKADSDDATRWREIEVELASGSPKLLTAARKRLRKAGARSATVGSKLGRLLAEAVPENRDERPASGTRDQHHPGRRNRHRTHQTAGDVVVSYVATQRQTILDYDPRVRLSEYDSVHKMRVAVRRIRSILRTNQRLLDPERTGSLDAELKWLADALGEVRDLEVLRERFAAHLVRCGDDSPEWLVGLGVRERAAQTRLNTALCEQRYFDLLDVLDDFIADPPLTSEGTGKAGTTVPGIVAKAWRLVGRKFAQIDAGETEEARANARHSARKAAKRARYTAEAATPVLGRPATDIVTQATRLQEALGSYQDSVVARERLASMLDGTEGSGAGKGEAFTLGVLTGIERCTAEEALRDIDQVWKKASKARYIRGLDRLARDRVTASRNQPRWRATS